MNFVKFHGTGNDFIILDNMKGETVFEPALIIRLCERATGIGADGLILAERSPLGASARMHFYNADGSEAGMCGNGIRCLAKFLRERGLSDDDPLFIETGSGVRQVWPVTEGSRVVGAEVDMGLPELTRERIPMTGSGDPLDEEVEVDGETVRVTCVSMGNPHCVIFTDDVVAAPVERIGRALEHHQLFPERTNVEFVQMTSRTTMTLRVWERGVGETNACGTGACASFVAAQRMGLADTTMLVTLAGGQLALRLGDGGHIMMRGPAVEVFSGTVSDEWLEG
ncbi:MAG: diaminopimelate epimerase [Candidatus Geothermincolia bacterium]